MTVLTLIPFVAILWFIFVELSDIKDELKKIREAKEKEGEK
jgi:hypothetical protein